VNLITDIIKYMEPYIDIFQLIAAIIVSFIVLNIALRLIKRYLLKKVKTKKQASNKYLFAFFFIIIVIAVYSENLGELGFVAGLLTVAVGWALQKPISGVVAWLIIVSRRPFNIGDRVVISDIKGDIINISLTHIFLDEIGGTIDGEEKSRRTVMIPHLLLET
jgi:small-conductance mechanosensitive channel